MKISTLRGPSLAGGLAAVALNRPLLHFTHFQCREGVASASVLAMSGSHESAHTFSKCRLMPNLLHQHREVLAAAFVHIRVQIAVGILDQTAAIGKYSVVSAPLEGVNFAEQQTQKGVSGNRVPFLASMLDRVAGLQV